MKECKGREFIRCIPDKIGHFKASLGGVAALWEAQSIHGQRNRQSLEKGYFR